MSRNVFQTVHEREPFNTLHPRTHCHPHSSSLCAQLLALSPPPPFSTPQGHQAGEHFDREHWGAGSGPQASRLRVVQGHLLQAAIHRVHLHTMVRPLATHGTPNLVPLRLARNAQITTLVWGLPVAARTLVGSGRHGGLTHHGMAPPIRKLHTHINNQHTNPT
jgi:hypothetical protein